jgi:hypothetical protein
MGKRCLKCQTDAEVYHDFVCEEMADYLENLQNVYQSNGTKAEFKRFDRHQHALNKKLKRSTHRNAEMSMVFNLIY